MKLILDYLFLIITYGSILLSVFVVLLINSAEVRRGRANLFLSILILSLAFSCAHILFAGTVLTHLSARVYSFGDPTFYLIAPLLWFYTLELTGKRVVLGKSMGHFVPFFIIITLSLSLPRMGMPSLLNFLNQHHHKVSVMFWFTVAAQFSCYLFLVQRRWASYHLTVREEVSSMENVSIGWVRFFMTIFIVINLLLLVGLFAAIHLTDRTWLLKATALTFSFSIFLLGYKGILQREVFQKAEESQKSKTDEPAKEKSDPMKLSLLKTYMEEKRPYLDADLTLTDLAKLTGMTRGQLSALINESGDNFYDFVNKYRVEQVKKLMTDPAFKNYNMLGLALEAGFKSKSTFNLIFKRFTGLTPTGYRNTKS